MKRFHIALAVADLDLDRRLQRPARQPPQVVVAGTYACGDRSAQFLDQPAARSAGQLRHVGFEDDAVTGFTREADVNGIEWESFSTVAQDLRIVSTYGMPPRATAEDDD